VTARVAIARRNSALQAYSCAIRRPRSAHRLGLASLGFRRGDKIAVIATTGRSYWTMVAAQALAEVRAAHLPGLHRGESALRHRHPNRAWSSARTGAGRQDPRVEGQAAAVELVVYDDPKGMRPTTTRSSWSRQGQERGAAFAAPIPATGGRAGQGPGLGSRHHQLHLGATGFPRA